MYSRVVKWFSPSKGYGFIDMPGESDVFFHVNDLRQSGASDVGIGDRLMFDIYEKPDGKRSAVRIQIA